MWQHSILVILLATHAQSLIHSPPLITKQPPSDELFFKVAQAGAETDKPFIIECEAEGEPAPTYEWVKNGKNFDWATYDNRISVPTGRGSLVITSPRDEDLGQYQCFAVNEHGRATSNSVFVRKSELNQFKDESVKNLTASEGEPFKLECQPPDGWPKPTVHWLIKTTEGSIKSINNSRMTLDPEGNLWMSNVTRVDSSFDKIGEYFYYVCSATSPFRNEYKLGNLILLDVVQTGYSTSNRVAPVQQYVSRKNEVALRGEKIELFCIYGGTPLPQIVWTKNGQVIKWNDRVTQANYGKSLLIRSVLFDDAGDYTCEASNGVGQARSYSINLQISAKPYFTEEPELVNAAEDEEAIFRCEAKGSPEPTIKWIFNGKPISEAPSNNRRYVSANMIRITKVEKTDTGNYGCNATNSLGYVYKDVYLNVLALPPEITDAPRLEATVDKRNVTLRCRVFGAPKPQVKWIKNGLELTGGRYKIAESGDLEITDVSFSDAGEFQCYASNKLGSTSANGTLTVRDSTKITEAPQDYEVPAGKSATFRCNVVADGSLELKITWLKDDTEIDFSSDNRFIKSNDNSLTISKTTELDSGDYTCLAETELDSVSAKANLRVQDAPNPPEVLGVICRAKSATLNWKQTGDNRSPILHYTIQTNTSFTPSNWENAYEKVPNTEHTYDIDMSPWANYTFRVIAWNSIGPSKPSKHSDSCTTQPDVPYKNPENVEGRGTDPHNLVIKWTPMPQIDHNGPNFHYKVSWTKDTPTSNFQHVEIKNWNESSYFVPDQEVFQKYRIKVVALNELGEANVSANEVIGYSGEDHPEAAPGNLTVVQIISSDSALLQWDPVTPESIRGHFKGYKVETWTEAEGEAKKREVQIIKDARETLLNKLPPNSKNYARILAYNGRYNGPPSNTVFFETPEGKPGTVQMLEATPLGSSALWLTWKEPLQRNGELTGYKIYYEEVEGSKVGTLQEREPHIEDPRQMSAKLAKLRPDTKYRIHIKATTKAGEGEDFYVEKATLVDGAGFVPDIPDFSLDKVPASSGTAVVKVNWHPSRSGKAGSHFFAKYRQKDSTNWEETSNEESNDFIDVKGLNPSTHYEFKVVAVDGSQMTESASQFVHTSEDDGPAIVGVDNVATAGWFIGMILALAFLILILSIICIIKRNRGGKYDVHDRELANGRRDFDEGGFHEYSQPLDNKSQGRQSTSSNLTKPGPESDTDSMAEYGEGDTGMNEDGSFIGQYGRKGRNTDTNNQAFATLV